MIIDGRAIAGEILENVRAGLPEGSPPVVCAISVAPNKATRSYLRMKSKAAEAAGMVLQIIELPDTATSEDVIQAISESTAAAIIVQLPLPTGLDQARILNSIPLAKDADVLSAEGYSRFLYQTGRTPPPVAGAVGEILARTGNISVSGKKAVVVGKGRLVGLPVAAWLTMAGADVSILHGKNSASYEPNETSFENGSVLLKNADIIVSGAGSPHLIKPSMIQEGAILIDAGTSEQGSELVGDMDPACAEIASIFTPTPGGVGPIAVACLFQNVANLLPVSSSFTN